MIKKTLRNAAVGTLAAGAMILPAATTVAPSLQMVNSNCNYPKSVSTGTDLDILPPVVGQRQDFRTRVDVYAGNATPNGSVTVTVTAPNGNTVRQRTGDIGPNSRVTFGFQGFRLGKAKSRTYTVTARFNGSCRFQNSSDTGFLTVQK